MNSRWKQYLLFASLIILGGGLIYILVETVRAKNTGFETKTLWDWMELLIIPLFLAGGAFFLNRSERNTEREIATDRQQEAALQSYIDRMAGLLLNEALRTSKNEEVRNVARISTLTVLRGLDAKRKSFVLIFLHEADLIRKGNPIVNLTNVDLSRVDLERANLKDADLSGANLQAANLELTNLAGANLERTTLEGANLQQTNLEGASLARANLRNANLINHNLHGVNFQGAYLGSANLALANLENANLEGAYLQGATLLHAHLENANLRDAIMEYADLRRAHLKGATMPDGTIHD